MAVYVVIPSRFASTRLPQKPLADINGKPMVQHVYERALQIKGVDRVLVATDHSQIFDVVKNFGGEAIMTPESLCSGTDRVAFVAQQPLVLACANQKQDIFINLQGDEPLLQAEVVEKTLSLVASGRFAMATAAAPLEGLASLDNPNIVKVLLDSSDRAIYFSRFPIPYSRGERPSNLKDMLAMHHVGLYIYQRDTLLKFAGLPQSPLEVAESLEQLRALYHGIPIGVARVAQKSIGVDTPEDLEMVRKLI